MDVEYPDGLTIGEESYRELFFTGKPFLLYFSSPACGPCFRLRPQLKRVVEHTKLPLVQINITEERVIFEQYDIPGSPSVLLIRDKRILKQWDGHHGHSKYKKDIEKLL